MCYKWVKLSKMGRFKKIELNIPSCRAFRGLSENHKIVEIGPSEFKLWPFKTQNSKHSVLTVHVCSIIIHIRHDR